MTRKYTVRPKMQDTFRLRMKDQCYLIEQYRLAVLENEGRYLSRDQAALEWIERHAESFAQCSDSCY